MSPHKRKKVLVVSYFFPPVGGGGVARTVKFVKYLRDFGYEPIVLAPEFPAHSAYDSSFEHDIPKDVLVVRTHDFVIGTKKKRDAAPETHTPPPPPAKRKSGLLVVGAKIFRSLVALFFVPDPHAGWRLFAVKGGLEIIQKYGVELIYSTSSPYTNHLVARSLHRKTGIPWVADFRDHWTLSALYRAITPFHRWLHRAMEKSIYREAAAVVLNQEQNEKDVVAHFGSLVRRHVAIPNGFDPMDFSHHEYMHAEPITFRYFGSLYAEYSVVPLLRILEAFLLETKREVRIEFIGDIDRLNREALMASPFFNTHIFILPYLSHREVIPLMQRTTVLLATLPHFDSGEAECMIPQKIYEYLGAGRPILACVHPEGMTAKLLRSLQAGLAVSQNQEDVQKSVEHIEAALVEWSRNSWKISLDPQKLLPFQRRVQTQKLAQLFDEVTREA